MFIILPTDLVPNSRLIIPNSCQILLQLYAKYVKIVLTKIKGGDIMNINSSELKQIINNRAKGIPDYKTLRDIRNNREQKAKKLKENKKRQNLLW